MKLKWYVGRKVSLKERYPGEEFQEERVCPLLFGVAVVQEALRIKRLLRKSPAKMLAKESEKSPPVIDFRSKIWYTIWYTI